MADNNNPFGSYSEKNVGRTVQNVTSSMWEPISAGPSVQKDTPVRKNPQQGTAKNKKAAPSPEKRGRTKKAASVDVTKDRISEGGRKTAVPEEKKNPKKTSDSKKKKPSSEKSKKPASGKSREPKGRDTRNLSEREKKAELQREQKRARERAKSREKAKEKSRQGMSYDEMRKKTSRARRIKAKVIALATVLIALIVVGCCAGAYAYSKGAPVAVINIVGENRYKDKKIIEAANVFVGINMLSVREKAVNSAVTKALPYIKDVQVEYQLPDTLVLNVTSTQEKYLIPNGAAGYICLDADGKVLSLKKKKLENGRFLIEGLEEQTATVGESFVPSENNKEKYEKVREIVSALEATGKFIKGSVDVTDMNDVSVVYDGRINIYLGSCPKLESQLGFALNVIEKDEDIINGQTGYIETRYEGQVTFKPGSMKK